MSPTRKPPPSRCMQLASWAAPTGCSRPASFWETCSDWVPFHCPAILRAWAGSPHWWRWQALQWVRDTAHCRRHGGCRRRRCACTPSLPPTPLLRPPLVCVPRRCLQRQPLPTAQPGPPCRCRVRHSGGEGAGQVRWGARAGGLVVHCHGWQQPARQLPCGGAVGRPAAGNRLAADGMLGRGITPLTASLQRWWPATEDTQAGVPAPAHRQLWSPSPPSPQAGPGHGV
jgi:hypothetical protein